MDANEVRGIGVMVSHGVKIGVMTPEDEMGSQGHSYIGSDLLNPSQCEYEGDLNFEASSTQAWSGSPDWGNTTAKRFPSAMPWYAPRLVSVCVWARGNSVHIAPGRYLLI